MANLKDLKQQWYDLNKQYREIDEKRKTIETQLADVIARDRGLAIGMILVQTTHRWQGNKRVPIKTRYRVESFKYASWRRSEDSIDILCVTLRKDGSDGRRRELYGSYEIENASKPETVTAG